MASVSCGIVGLPNVGKSTLFNALLKKQVAASANYPFTTIEPNVGVVEVPDDRLEKLKEVVEKSEGLRPEFKIVPAIVKFVDIAGLVKGASKGEGLGNQFLAHIREVDAIVHVLREFEDQNVIRAGSESPKVDRAIVETELQLADLQVAQKLLENTQKDYQNPDSKLKTTILASMVNKLEQGGQVSEVEVPDRLNGWEKTLPLITNKPVIYVYNVSEDSLIRHYDDTNHRSENSIVICAKLEEELASLSQDEQKQYLAELGIDEPGLSRLIKKAYETLGLVSFLTAGSKEVRAWTVKKGTLAPQAATVIHTDFERGFIAADVVPFEKFVEVGGWQKARAAGVVRAIGKSEEVLEGYVVEFKFSV